MIKPKFPVRILENFFVTWNGNFHLAEPVSFLRFKMADMQSFLFVSELVNDFAQTNDILEDNDDDIVVLAAVSCYMRRKLTVYTIILRPLFQGIFVMN